MNLKYQIQMDLFSGKCPPENYVFVNMPAFRWIFERIDDAEAFQPLYFKNPQRVNGFGDAEKCQSLGLSMFNSAEHAIKQFNFW